MSELKDLIEKSGNTVFFGGAGVSTESGIPDFRSAHGIYMQKKQGISYEDMCSHGYFVSDTAGFYDFFKGVMLYPEAKPNPAHLALAKLEREGKLRAVITQNIDGLHQAAGSKNVIELHGSALKYYCLSCGKKYGLDYIMESQGVPRCSCGGVIRPEVVLYGEQLDSDSLERAVCLVEEAQLLIVGGTSLVVYPVAGLINYLSKSAKLVIINRDPTGYDRRADLVLRENIADALSEAAEL